MTDGAQRVFGMEYRPIKDLKVLTPAGLKVFIFYLMDHQRSSPFAKEISILRLIVSGYKVTKLQSLMFILYCGIVHFQRGLRSLWTTAEGA